MTYKGAPLMSIDQSWATPQTVIDWLEDRFQIKFDLDAAATNKTAKARRWFTEEDNALNQQWFGHVFLNPPFGKGGKLQRLFIEKCVEQMNNTKSITVLIPARTDTKLFHEVIMPNAQSVHFVYGRINFIKTGNTVGHANATFPSMIVRFRPKRTGKGHVCQLRTAIMPQCVRRGV